MTGTKHISRTSLNANTGTGCLVVLIIEIDTVIEKNHKGAFLTIKDRATGLVWIRLL